MEIVIVFFRDVLSGPVYITVAIICFILICSCIGYLAEQSEIEKNNKAKAKAENSNMTTNEHVEKALKTGDENPNMITVAANDEVSNITVSNEAESNLSSVGGTISNTSDASPILVPQDSVVADKKDVNTQQNSSG